MKGVSWGGERAVKGVSWRGRRKGVSTVNFNMKLFFLQFVENSCLQLRKESLLVRTFLVGSDY